MSFSEWKSLKLGDICDITSSKRIYAKEYKSSGIPFYRGKEIIEKFKGNTVSTELFITKERFDELTDKFGAPAKGDILLSSVGTLGVPYLVQDEKFYFKDGNLTWFKNFIGSCSKYLFLWLQSSYAKNQIDCKAIGSTQKALTIDVLKKFEINLPPIQEQKAIAETLSCLDDKIVLNNRINKTLEEIAQAFFKSWFMDFEPFQDGEFEDNEFGRIPKGWRVRELGEIVEIINGYSYKGSELTDSDDALMTIKNFDRNGGLKIDGFKEIEVSGRVKERQYLNLFDVLVACTDLTQKADIIGNPILVLTKSKYNNLIASMDLVKVVPKVSFISNFLLYILMKDEKFKQFALGYTSGTTVLH